ncbi:MAG: hypothetical protein ACJ8DJ_07340 [Gemmatimonadales bacterium]
MTVSFLFGWQHILIGLVLLIVLAAIFLVVLAAGPGRRSDWQAFLDARSLGHPDLAPDEDDAPGQRATEVSRPRPR